MGATGTARFRVIVLLLLILIIWQAYKLLPQDKTEVEDIRGVLLLDKPVDVIVFYEALCPDSRYFFIHHLENTFNKLKGYMSLTLIPYGKAKTVINPEGVIEFECQHGELECQANKIHACAIEKIADSAVQLKFVNCMIRDNTDPEEALKRCGSTLSVDISKIDECSKKDQGSLLLKGHGEATDVVKPSFIPTILINGSKDNQAIILKNFISEVCKHFTSTKPPACT